MKFAAIDATVISMGRKFSWAGGTVYGEVLLRTPEGITHILPRAQVGGKLRALVKPGANGRFYLFEAIGICGLFGFRSVSGISVHHWPGENAEIYAVLLAANLGWMLVTLWVDGGVSPLLCAGTLGVFLRLHFLRKAARTARALFDAEAGPVAGI